ncbi:hypothetical protein QCE62_22680 [Caballeronia sp. LZ033]|uniref:hypothetical protein n=1 Tax=Caballeronia sp. LZ033 TaxID=3038566 RepID=UPI00286784F3|nr:hypothetical protein [Caballeronia sp. LZ033]MDR5816404.1 hypothetical protein [Caballeronia sp. LZ033]
MQLISRLIRILSVTATAGSALMVLSTAHANTPAAADVAAQAEPQAHTLDMKATVVKVHADTSSVEVKGPKGRVVVIDVDPAVADVKKLKAGDEVHVSYRGALLISADPVDPKAAESRVIADETAPASGGVVVKKHGVQVVAVVQKIDTAAREVTLAGPKHTVTVQVAPDMPLDKIKVGDRVTATYVAATAMNVTRGGHVVK